MLGEGPNFRINGRFDSLEKKFSIDFTKTNKKFSLSFHYNADNSYLFVDETKYLSLKLTMKMLTFQLNFVLEVFLMDLVLLSLQKYGNGNV